jgi:hypothetical protein
MTGRTPPTLLQGSQGCPWTQTCRPSTCPLPRWAPGPALEPPLHQRACRGRPRRRSWRQEELGPSVGGHTQTRSGGPSTCPCRRRVCVRQGTRRTQVFAIVLRVDWVGIYSPMHRCFRITILWFAHSCQEHQGAPKETRGVPDGRGARWLAAVGQGACARTARAGARAVAGASAAATAPSRPASAGQAAGARAEAAAAPWPAAAAAPRAADAQRRRRTRRTRTCSWSAASPSRPASSSASPSASSEWKEQVHDDDEVDEARAHAPDRPLGVVTGRGLVGV